jgi:hypothetical protein
MRTSAGLGLATASIGLNMNKNRIEAFSFISSLSIDTTRRRCNRIQNCRYGQLPRRMVHLVLA